MRPIRLLVAGALLLLLAITTTSAYIRLSLAGLGCSDWPDCYRAAQAAGAAVVDVDIARGLHRIVATIAGVWLVVLVGLGWADLRQRAPRALAVALVVLAGLLAWLGTVTPSALPAVTLGNLLGGMLMLACAAWLTGWFAVTPGRAALPARAPASDPRAAARRAPAWIALGLVLLQMALGALLGAQGAAAECAALPVCDRDWLAAPIGWSVFWPFAADGSAQLPEVRAAGLAALHMAHRGTGLLVVAAVAWASLALWRWRAPRSSAATAGASIALVSALGLPVLGAQMVSAHYPLALALSHNLLAALMLTGLCLALGARMAQGAAGASAGAAAVSASEKQASSDRRWAANAERAVSTMLSEPHA